MNVRNYSRIRMTQPGMAGSDDGFSLIEVTLALGLLATVLISIASLFIIGGKQVHQGKSTTSATAVGQTIMERIDQLPYIETYGYFGGTDTSTALAVNTTTTGNNANQWQSEIQSRLGPNAFGTIAVTPLGSASPLNMGSASALRVRVTVNWRELGRLRSISLQTIRF
jgi:type II secretory pathway pseudopilin PulG